MSVSLFYSMTNFFFLSSIFFSFSFLFDRTEIFHITHILLFSCFPFAWTKLNVYLYLLAVYIYLYVGCVRDKWIRHHTGQVKLDN